MITILLLIAIISYLLHITNNNLNDNYDYSKTLKVLTPEWGVAATLVDMGVPPYAIGSKRIYPKYYPNTPLPKNTIEVGLRGQPNMELMAQLDANITIDTNFYDFTRQYYGAHTDVTTIDFGIVSNENKKLPDLSVYTKAVLDIGDAINKPKAAQAYISNGLKSIEKDGETVRKLLGDNRQFFITSFASSSQLKAYGINHPAALSADIMGLDVIFLGNPDSQGYVTLPIHTLYELPDNTCLIIVDPITTIDQYEIPRSQIWKRSPFAKSDACIYKIDTVWSRGGFNTLIIFAHNLKSAITSQSQNKFNYNYKIGKAATTLETVQ